MKYIKLSLFALCVLTSAMHTLSMPPARAEETTVMQPRAQRLSCEEICKNCEQRCEARRARRDAFRKQHGYMQERGRRPEMSCKELCKNCPVRCEQRRARRAEYRKKYGQKYGGPRAQHWRSRGHWPRRPYGMNVAPRSPELPMARPAEAIPYAAEVTHPAMLPSYASATERSPITTE